MSASREDTPDHVSLPDDASDSPHEDTASSSVGEREPAEDQSNKDDASERRDSVSSVLRESLVTEQAERGSRLFDDVDYLGSSTVDAPVSETEANRKMSVLRTQAKDCIPVILAVPPHNGGSVVLKDAVADQPLAAFAIRHVLFAARGQADTELDGCFSLNVLHKRSGVYHCHVFHCKAPETVSAMAYSLSLTFGPSYSASKYSTQ